MSKRAGMTAGEMLAQQAANPEYQAMRAERDRELATFAERRKQEQQPLLKDLAMAGVAVDWVGEILSIQVPDQRIYFVLLDHITKPYNPWLLEWIGRAIGSKSARLIVWDRPIKLLKTDALQASAVTGVMIAISEMAQPSDLDTLIDLISDPSLGPSRIFLVGNLTRSKKPEARSALLRNQADPDLTKEITARLSRSRS